MHAIDALPRHVILAALLWLLAAVALWRGIQGLATGLCKVHHPASALRVVRGIRGVIVAVSLAALGGGVLCASTGLLVFGLIFLGEELYETGVVLGPARGPAGRVGTEIASSVNGLSPMPYPNSWRRMRPRVWSTR